jgi:hypothetical protein
MSYPGYENPITVQKRVNVEELSDKQLSNLSEG